MHNTGLLEVNLCMVYGVGKNRHLLINIFSSALIKGLITHILMVFK